MNTFKWYLVLNWKISSKTAMKNIGKMAKCCGLDGCIAEEKSVYPGYIFLKAAYSAELRDLIDRKVSFVKFYEENGKVIPLSDSDVRKEGLEPSAA